MYKLHHLSDYIDALGHMLTVLSIVAGLSMLPFFLPRRAQDWLYSWWLGKIGRQSASQADTKRHE